MALYVSHRLAVTKRRRQAPSFSDAGICSHDSLRVVCGRLIDNGKGFFAENFGFSNTI